MADKELLTAPLRLRAPWYISRIDVEVASDEAHVTTGNREISCVHHPLNSFMTLGRGLGPINHGSVG